MCTILSGYNDDMTTISDQLKQQVFVIAGTISLLLGIIGIIVPVLPTTPFLLLAAFCFIRGSNRLYTALLNNRFIGTYIRNYMEGRGMSRRMKIWTLSMLWVAISFTVFFASDSLVVKIILAVVLIGVTVHILMIKTIKNKHGLPGKP